MISFSVSLHWFSPCHSFPSGTMVFPVFLVCLRFLLPAPVFDRMPCLVEGVSLPQECLPFGSISVNNLACLRMDGECVVPCQESGLK